MSTWKVNAGGKEHIVRMESPAFGRKVIYVDGQELKKVGLPVSMWASYKFDLDGAPAFIKFRAVKRMKGMSLYVNNERVDPEPGGEMSAEALQWFMLSIPLLLLIGVGFAAFLR